MSKVIDIHCHIIPGVDDGAVDLAMALTMANAARREGITHILATPHHRSSRYVNKKEDVEKHVLAFQEELDRRGIDLVIFPSQEVHMHGELLTHIEENEILYTDLNQTYLLIEFPHQDVPKYAYQLIFDLLTKNIRPIIVHPERNIEIMKNPKILQDFIEQGCYVQLTAASYLGIFGKEIEQVATYMIENRLVHIIASDAHRPDGKRAFHMAEAYQKLEQNYGDALVFDFKQNARSVVNGDPLIIQSEEITLRKKRWFHWRK